LPNPERAAPGTSYKWAAHRGLEGLDDARRLRAMNKTVWLARILSIGGVLETGTGLALLVDPSAVAFLLLRSPLEGPGVVVARLAGGGLLALGVACWYARGTPSIPAGLGVSRAFLAYNLVACVVLAMARPPFPVGLVALGASVLHGLLAVALLVALYGPRRAPTVT
jgi:hypothetical protein